LVEHLLRLCAECKPSPFALHAAGRLAAERDIGLAGQLIRSSDTIYHDGCMCLRGEDKGCIEMNKPSVLLSFVHAAMRSGNLAGLKHWLARASGCRLMNEVACRMAMFLEAVSSGTRRWPNGP
jgi:hypothetical protein